MGAPELRNKLIEQFNLILQDDSRLATLDGIFDAMNAIDSPSSVTEEHYKIVEQRRQNFHTGESKGLSWEEVKLNLRNKYGF